MCRRRKRCRWKLSCWTKKIPKITPEQEIFATTYYEFPGNFTTNLKGSKKFLQLSLGVSTQYDEQVMANVDSHQLALRSEILTIMSTFSSEDIAGREGKQKLADALKEGINEVLVKLKGLVVLRMYILHHLYYNRIIMIGFDNV